MSKWERFKLLDKKDRIAVVVSLLYLVWPLFCVVMAFAENEGEIFAIALLSLIPLVLYWGYRAVIAKPSTAAQPSKATSQPDLYAELTKLGDLKDRGLLTEEEFLEQKKVILDRH